MPAIHNHVARGDSIRTVDRSPDTLKSANRNLHRPSRSLPFALSFRGASLVVTGTFAGESYYPGPSDASSPAFCTITLAPRGPYLQLWYCV